MVPRPGYSEMARILGGFASGYRAAIIGLIAFWREDLIPPDEWRALQQLAKRVAPSVEASITFSDLTDHLGRMALLNDFAVTITSALDPEQIAQRLFALLERSFGTDRISMVVLSPDGNGLQNFSNRDGVIIIQTMSIDDISVASLMGKGDVHRVDSI